MSQADTPRDATSTARQVWFAAIRAAQEAYDEARVAAGDAMDDALDAADRAYYEATTL